MTSGIVVMLPVILSNPNNEGRNRLSNQTIRLCGFDGKVIPEGNPVFRMGICNGDYRVLRVEDVDYCSIQCIKKTVIIWPESYVGSQIPTSDYVMLTPQGNESLKDVSSDE